MVLLNKTGDQQPQQQPKIITGSSTTSELGLTVSNGNQMVGQAVPTAAGIQQVAVSSGSGSPTLMLPHPQHSQQQQQSNPGGLMMPPNHQQQQQYVVLSPSGVQQVVHAPPPAPAQVVYVQSGSHPGSGMTTPSMSMSGNQGINMLAPPPPQAQGNFSGSGSTGLVPSQPMMIPTGMGTPAAFLPAQPQLVQQQPQQIVVSGAPTPTTSTATAPPAGVTADPADNGPKQIIVNYLPTQVTELELRSLFEQHGAVECARVIYDKASGVSKGYGFVYYFSSQHAATALKEMQGFELYGKPIRVGYAVPQRPLSSLSPYGGGSAGGGSRGPSP